MRNVKVWVLFSTHYKKSILSLNVVQLFLARKYVVYFKRFSLFIQLDLVILYSILNISLHGTQSVIMCETYLNIHCWCLIILNIILKMNDKLLYLLQTEGQFY